MLSVVQLSVVWPSIALKLGIVWHVLVGEDGHIDADVCANSKFLEPVYDE